MGLSRGAATSIPLSEVETRVMNVIRNYDKITASKVFKTNICFTDIV